MTIAYPVVWQTWLNDVMTETVSARRYFLLHGWARYLARSQGILENLAYIKNARPRGNWAILVADDRWARQYQRLYFRYERARYAVRSYGLVGKTSYGADGFHRYTREEIAECNRQSFDAYRQRAHRAKHGLPEPDQRRVEDVINDDQIDQEMMHLATPAGW